MSAIKGVYASNSYNDDLVYAALWLHLASNATSSPYLTEAVEMYNSFGLRGSNAVFNWDSATPALPILLASIFPDNATYSNEVKRYFDAINSSRGKAGNSENAPSFTKDGLLYYSADSRAASLNPALYVVIYAD